MLNQNSQLGSALRARSRTEGLKFVEHLDILSKVRERDTAHQSAMQVDQHSAMLQ